MKKPKTFVENKKQKIIKGTTAAVLVITMLAGNYVFYYQNPFDGRSIKAPTFVTKVRIINARRFLYDETLKEAVDSIENLSEDEINALLLVMATIKNHNLSKEELERVKYLVREWGDNQYLDLEEIYDKLQGLKVKRKVNFSDSNILEEYDRDENTIYFGKVDNKKYKTKEEKQSQKEKIYDKTSHVLRHLSRTSDISENETWLEEAYCSIRDAEDSNLDWDYSLGTNTIRFLCEILGPTGAEIIKEARTTGHIEILTSELEKNKIPNDICYELYDLEDEYVMLQLEEQTEEVIARKKEICKSVAYYLAYMYDVANNNPENETGNVQILLNHILEDKYLSIKKYKYYIYNKDKQNEYPYLTEILFDETTNEQIGYTKYQEEKVISYKKNNVTGKMELIASKQINGRTYLDRALSYNNFKKK